MQQSEPGDEPGEVVEAPRSRRDFLKSGLINSGLISLMLSWRRLESLSRELFKHEPSPSPTTPPLVLLSPESQAIERGLDWLALRQRTDGGFGLTGTSARNVGVCALAGLAFLAQDGVKGAHETNVRRFTDYLLDHADDEGLIGDDEARTPLTLYGHGFATIYLGQVYGEDHRRIVQRTLQRAILQILMTQEADGGWRNKDDQDHLGDADVSLTACLMMGLYSGQQAGVDVLPEAVDRGVQFLLGCQSPDGGFRQRLKDPPFSVYPRSAAAAVALATAGLSNDSAVRSAVRRCRHYLANTPLPSTSTPLLQENYYYGLFYAAHSAWLAGDEAWEPWYRSIRVELLKKQTAAGYWGDPHVGDEYATAMALLVLQFPSQSIPLFIR